MDEDTRPATAPGTAARFAALHLERRRAQQRERAARLLSSRGHRAVAFQLARDALGGLATATADLALPAPARAHREEAVALLSSAVAAPASDEDVAEAHEDLTARMLRSLRRLRRATASFGDPPDRGRATLLRGALLAIAVAVVSASAWALVPRTSVSATDSTEEHDPSKAVDGLVDSYWFLPDGAAGALELHFSRARPVRRVWVLNGQNQPNNDRGTRDYRIELVTNGAVVRVATGRFDHPEQPSFVRHELRAESVDVVRFVVLSHDGASAGLAEIHVE